MRIPRIRFIGTAGTSTSAKTVTKDFAGTDGVAIDVYDDKFIEQGSNIGVLEIYNPSGEAELRNTNDYSRGYYFYDQGESGGDQTSIIVAKCGETVVAGNRTAPVVRMNATTGYGLFLLGDATTVSAAQLRTISSGNDGAYLAQITGLSISATSFVEYELSVTDNGSNQPVFTAVLDGTTYADFHTEDTDIYLTGQPGFTFYAHQDVALYALSSFTSIVESASSIPVSTIKHYRKFLGGM